jgi:hypothetical protein
MFGNPKKPQPWDLIHLFRQALYQGDDVREVTEFAKKKDYANNDL